MARRLTYRMNPDPRDKKEKGIPASFQSTVSFISRFYFIFVSRYV